MHEHTTLRSSTVIRKRSISSKGLPPLANCFGLGQLQETSNFVDLIRVTMKIELASVKLTNIPVCK